MDKFVDYKEVPLGDKNYWEVDRDLVQGGVGNADGWDIEYKPVWDVKERLLVGGRKQQYMLVVEGLK